VPSRSLKPPPLFMSRRQAKVNAALCGSRVGIDSDTNSGTSLTGDDAATDMSPQAAANFRRAKKRASKRKSKRFTVEITTEEDAYSWGLHEQAGVRFWVNRITGEAQEECPFPDLLQHQDPGAAADSRAHFSSKERLALLLDSAPEIATGAIVYNRREFEQAMWMLESGDQGLKM
jgi:hypothetical protein